MIPSLSMVAKSDVWAFKLVIEIVKITIEIIIARKYFFCMSVMLMNKDNALTLYSNMPSKRILNQKII